MRAQRVYLAVLLLLVLVTAYAGWRAFHSIGSFAELSEGLREPGEFVNLAEKFAEAEQYKDAEQAYKKAIELDAGSQLKAYAALHDLYNNHLEDKKDNLPRLYERGLSKNPKSRVLMRGLARYYEEAGDKTRAAQWYRRVLRLYPQDMATRRALEEL